MIIPAMRFPEWLLLATLITWAPLIWIAAKVSNVVETEEKRISNDLKFEMCMVAIPFAPIIYAIILDHIFS